ncbi:MAG: nucleotidyltransferase domain-containing protein [Candidatus Daviesbacteria bacterium]|nr:MAG: nucleotidyltransferase domain-containing protein [Candidatus Daviesbacteria bacterium]
MGNDELVGQIKAHLEKVFGQRKYFALIYGSFANGMRNVGSDVDLCVITEEFSMKELAALIRFILDLHSRNKLKVDNEVPFENKLMASYQDAEDASYMTGFEVRHEQIIIPPVEKSKNFLESRAVKLRLILNALTSPHIKMGNDLETYKKFKALAEKNTLLLAISLSFSDSFELDKLLQSLMIGRRGEEGEMYLGYKQYPSVQVYMKTWLQKQGGKLAKINKKNEWKKLVKEAKRRSVIVQSMN